MTILLVVLYVIVCVFLIAVVLLQTGKRADLAGAFGGGGSQTAFGTRGAANLLTKLTTVSAVAFMVLALTLSLLYRGGGAEEGSVLEEVEPTTSSEPAPVPPAEDPLQGEPAPNPPEEPVDGAEPPPPADGASP